MSGRHYAPSLSGAPDSSKLVKHKLDEIDPENEEYKASTFGGFSDYMRRKKQKLQNHDALLRSRAPTDNPPIFAGMTIHINGYTKPGRIDLWNMIVSYGGVYKQYLEGKTDVTHIVASNLTKSKQQEFSRYRIVRPEWIVDCISAGRALPWTDSRYRVLEAGHNQHTLQFSKDSGFSLGAERLSNSYKRDPPTPTSQVVSPAVPDPDEAEDSGTRKVAEITSMHPPAFVPRRKETTEPVTDESSVTAAPKIPTEAPITTGVDPVPETKTRPATKTAKDPDFIQDYFRNSRLHHLSTWKANLRLKIDNLAKSISPQPSPGPQRYIMHVDFDCFFAAVSSKNRPDVIGKACAVTHGGSNSGEIASCNYKAREFGIKNGMWMKEAVKLCPDIISLPYEFEAYEAASDVFYRVLLDLHASAIEAVSIDEALVNITNLMPESGDINQIESVAIDLAIRVRNLIREGTGVEVSVGIGANVLQAKLAIKKAKPAGQHFLRADQLLDTLDLFQVASLPGVGYSTGKKLQDAFEVTTVQELRQISQARLQEVFGPKTGISLAQASRGIDDTVVGDIAQRKLVSIEINWGIRLDTRDEVSDYMRRVSEELCKKLREVGFVSAQHLLVKVMRRSKTAPIDPPKFLGHGPCDKFNAGREIPMTGDASVVWKLSLALLEGLNIPPNELRGIGVALTKLQSVASTPEIAQRSVSNFFKAVPLEVPSEPLFKEPMTTVATKDSKTSEFAVPRSINRMAPPKHVPVVSAKPVTIQAVSPALSSSTQYVIPSQIDPSVLNELPKHIRDKIKPIIPPDVPRENGYDLEAHRIPSASQIDPADLAALPASLRHEIILHSRSNVHSPRKNVLDKYVVKTPSPKKRKKTGGIMQTLTQVRFVEQPVRKQLTSVFKDVAQQMDLSSSPSAEIDREVLAGLPEDLKREVLLADRNRRLATRMKDQKQIAKSVAVPNHAEEKIRRMIDLPQERPPGYGDLGTEPLETLRSYLITWYEDEKADGPDDGDISDFRGYLELLISQERDFERAEGLLKWLWQVVTKTCESQPWVQAVQELIDFSRSLLLRQGMGELKIMR